MSLSCVSTKWLSSIGVSQDIAHNLLRFTFYTKLFVERFSRFNAGPLPSLSEVIMLIDLDAVWLRLLVYIGYVSIDFSSISAFQHD